MYGQAPDRFITALCNRACSTRTTPKKLESLKPLLFVGHDLDGVNGLQHGVLQFLVTSSLTALSRHTATKAVN